MGWNKYGAKRTTIDGITFASKMEAERYKELKLMERAKLISKLTCQPKFPLVVNGVKVCTYIADFQYYDLTEHEWTYEDVKGFRTPIFRLKAKLFKALYPEHNLVLVGDIG